MEFLTHCLKPYRAVTQKVNCLKLGNLCSHTTNYATDNVSGGFFIKMMQFAYSCQKISAII